MKHTLPDGLDLYYEVHGPDNADVTLVFLGGLSQSTAAWGGLLPLQSKFRLVLVDLVFQGKSSSAPTYRSFNQHAADVAHLMEALNFGNYCLVGLSYGGAVAQRVLVNHPQAVTKAILLSSFALKDAYFNAIGQSWKAALIAGDYPLMLEVMLPSVLGRSYFLNPVIPVDILKNAKTTESPSTDNLLKLMQATEESGNFLPELAKVHVPVLVIHGEEDILCTPAMGKAISEAIPGSQLRIIEKVGHTLNLEYIPGLLQAVDSFCTRQAVSVS